MIKIRFHGRGGQGTVVASRLLADAVFREGKDVQSFPFFGVERRGAPVTAFVKIDTKPITDKSQIYEPDYVIVLDPALLRTIDVTRGLKDDGLVLINIDRAPKEIRSHIRKGRIATVDATAIAVQHKLGTKIAPIVNTALLGAFAKVTDIVNIDSIITTIQTYVRSKIDENVNAARAAFDSVQVE
jgi:2-oxoacid:acceptor oxidoreductase gamma subunit (pyruvate/2-ketoisovalerate family)